jgi:hypothetical protein
MSSDDEDINVIRDVPPSMRHVGRGLIEARKKCPEDPQWYFAYSGALCHASSKLHEVQQVRL